jgi:hypothetical protein
MVADVAKTLPSPVHTIQPAAAPGGDVQRLGDRQPAEPGKGTGAGSRHTEWGKAPPSNPTTLRPKTGPALQLTEINKALENLRLAKPGEVDDAKKALKKAVGDEMIRLSGHSVIYVARKPTEMRNAGERIIKQLAGNEDVREAVRRDHYGRALLDLVSLSSSIHDGQLVLNDPAAKEFIADAADWITTPSRGEGTNVAELAHNQFTRLHKFVSTSDSVKTSKDVLAALVVQCRKEPGWIISTESAGDIGNLKNLIGPGNPDANAVIKEYEDAAKFPAL